MLKDEKIQNLSKKYLCLINIAEYFYNLENKYYLKKR